MEELACLFYYVHVRFYETPTVAYTEAMRELGEMAWSLGYTMNDLAKMVTYAG